MSLNSLSASDITKLIRKKTNTNLFTLDTSNNIYLNKRRNIISHIPIPTQSGAFSLITKIFGNPIIVIPPSIPSFDNKILSGGTSTTNASIILTASTNYTIILSGGNSTTNIS